MTPGQIEALLEQHRVVNGGKARHRREDQGTTADLLNLANSTVM